MSALSIEAHNIEIRIDSIKPIDVLEPLLAQFVYVLDKQNELMPLKELRVVLNSNYDYSFETRDSRRWVQVLRVRNSKWEFNASIADFFTVDEALIQLASRDVLQKLIDKFGVTLIVAEW